MLAAEDKGGGSCVVGDHVVASLDRGICDGHRRREVEDNPIGEEGLKPEQKARLFVGVAGWRKGVMVQ